MRLLETLLAGLVVVAALFGRAPARSRLPRGVDPEDLAEGYEHSDAHVGLILAALAGLAVTVGLVVVVVSALEVWSSGLPVTLGPPQDLVNRLAAAPTPPAPRLETAEGQNFAAYQAAEQQRADSYAWVDRQSGRVSIPVQRAMDLVAQRGLPARQGSTAQDLAQTSPSAASSGRVAERIGP